MHEEPTTVIVQRYLDALPGDTAAELTVRELLERAAGRLRLLCTTLLYKSYEVEGELGRGGMGVVYQARHLRLNRFVALKMLLAGAFARPEERDRFLREAQALAALGHPNVVQVHEFGELDGLPYLTMEYVEGGSLTQKLAGTPLPASEAAALSATLAQAVEAAHRSGIIHRDLKPANVLLAADGTPKIGDFGLARRLDGGAGATLTGKLDEAERTRWRWQARDWLRADLAAWAKTLDKQFHGNPCSGQGNRGALAG